MSLADVLCGYAALNAAIVAAYLGLVAVESAARRLPPARLLSWHHAAAILVVIGALLAPALPAANVFDTAPRLWWSQDFVFFDDVAAHDAWPAQASWDSLYLDAGSVSRVWIAAVLALLALGSFRILRDQRALRALRRDSHCIRRLGRVHIWACERVAMPFSYWLPGAAHVVVPTWLIERPVQLRMVIAHELQHHRQGDTRGLHLFAALSWLCALNPFIHLWNLRLARVQEYACDAAVIGSRAWPTVDYAQCLLDVAARASGRTAPFRWSTPLIRFGDPNVLIRRIEKMLNDKPGVMNRSSQAAIAAILVAAVSISAYAASGLVHEMPGDTDRDAITRLAAGEGTTRWPVDDGEVLAGFAGKHHGLDIAAPAGATVRAFAPGEVIARGTSKGCGEYLQIRHAGGLTARYCNLAQVRVDTGDSVSAGDAVAVIAAAPEGQRAHLHFELKRGEEKVDPLPHLPRRTA